MKKIKVLSLGAGVQSSALLIMYEKNILKDKPDFAIFADTGTEPKSVYDFLQKLKKISSIPIYIASKGNIKDDTLSGNKFASVPFYIKKSDEDYKKDLIEWKKERSKIINVYPKGTKLKDMMYLPRKPKKIVMGRRQCTNEYKINVITKKIRDILGYKFRQRVKHQVEMIIGISTDEITRAKESRIKWIKNIFPLIEGKKSRDDCLEIMSDFNLKPPRSACWLCPYRTDKEWIHLKENDPSDFNKAIEFDKKIRTLDKFKYQNFLHKSCKPLDQVKFNPKKADKKYSMDNECEGICGL